MRKITFSLVLFALFISSPIKSVFAQHPTDAEITLTHGDSRVGSYVSSEKGFSTCSYWIEGPKGLILIDTQFLPSAASEAVDWIEATTGKKIVLAIVLHPNPDKFNGTAVLQKRGIRVVTSAQVLAKIPSVHKLRTEWFYDDFKPDYPTSVPQPDSFGSKSTILEVAGLKVKVHVLGAGCSDAHVVVEYDHHVFVGDLVTQGFHSWLELGMLDEWLKRLGEISALHPEYVHTGRGGSGHADLLENEVDYLRTVLNIVESYHPSKSHPFTDEISEKITTDIAAKYPSYKYLRFVENGLENVWNHLSMQP